MASAMPLVGVSTLRESASWGRWERPADLLPVNYAAALQTAGAVPMLLPPGAPDASRAATVAVAAVAGLLLSGGADVDPARYGAAPHVRTDRPRTDRDEWELALLAAALDRDVPVLAVCRGMQLLNVALGGTLIQHLPDVVGHDEHGPVHGGYARHQVRVGESSRLTPVTGDRPDVATHHHQAVDRLADGLVATAWAADGTVEAVELAGKRWVLGVQWHPEVDGGPVVDAFVAACRGE